MPRLSDALTERIATRVQRGVPLQTALKAAGVTDQVVSLWQQVSQGAPVLSDGTVVDEDTQLWVHEFVERIARAQAEFECSIVEGIGEAAATVGRSGVPEWRAGAWLLNNLEATRARYHEQKEVKLTGSATLTLEQQIVEDALRGADTLEEKLARLDALEAMLPQPGN